MRDRTYAPEMPRERATSIGFPAPVCCTGFGYIERHRRGKKSGRSREANRVPLAHVTARPRLALLSAEKSPRTRQLATKTKFAARPRSDARCPLDNVRIRNTLCVYPRVHPWSPWLLLAADGNNHGDHGWTRGRAKCMPINRHTRTCRSLGCGLMKK